MRRSSTTRALSASPTSGAAALTTPRIARPTATRRSWCTSRRPPEIACSCVPASRAFRGRRSASSSTPRATATGARRCAARDHHVTDQPAPTGHLALLARFPPTSVLRSTRSRWDRSSKSRSNFANLFGAMNRQLKQRRILYDLLDTTTDDLVTYSPSGTGADGLGRRRRGGAFARRGVDPIGPRSRLPRCSFLRSTLKTSYVMRTFTIGRPIRLHVAPTAISASVPVTRATVAAPIEDTLFFAVNRVESTTPAWLPEHSIPVIRRRCRLLSKSRRPTRYGCR